MLTDSDLDAMEAEMNRESAGGAFGPYVPHAVGYALRLIAEVRRLRGAPVIECETLPHLNPPVTIFRERLPGAATT